MPSDATLSPLSWVSPYRAETLFGLSRRRVQELMSSGAVRVRQTGIKRRKLNVQDLERVLSEGETATAPQAA
jgi:hypothetical protein